MKNAKQSVRINLSSEMASELSKISKACGITPEKFAVECVESAIAERRALRFEPVPEETDHEPIEA